MHNNQDEIAKNLAQKAIQLAGSKSNDLDKYSWITVHEYLHGSPPSEYDIRGIDENLYLQVLSIARNFQK